jgi:uncharacterized membrane protein YphA (DoxX/SURF4 family)
MMVVGAMKLFAYEKFKAQSEKSGPVGIPRGLATFIGVAELAGGLGIALPMATHIARSLSLWAAVGLSTIMLLAIGFHLRRHESPVAPGLLFLLAVFAVLGRFRIGGKQGAKRCPRGNAKDRDRNFEEFRLEPPG